MAKEKKISAKSGQVVKNNKKELAKPLVSARVTEKASMLSEAGIYTFNVHKDATKNEIIKAVFKSFNVKPIRVNVLPIEKKTVRVRGKIGVRGGGRKAVVYLKKGDTIDFV